MIKKITISIVLLFGFIIFLFGQNGTRPDTVSVRSSNLTLKALLWTPSGKGPFPTIIYCHGSYRDTETIKDLGLGPVFAKRGYLFLFLFRRGIGLSRDQGVNSADLIDQAFKEEGQELRNKVQMQQLETDQLQDMIAGFSFLKTRNKVDTNRMAAVGVSFGGSLALLLTEHEPALKAVVVFSPVAINWDRSAQLRLRLINAVKNISVPIMIIHAMNDYSINPGIVLDSVMNNLKKPHLLKIYPKFGDSPAEAHNLINLSVTTWENDVFNFLAENLRH
jgi:carboxymethylenebutenolidase